MSKELRGASRRDFMRGAVAVGAALGWGPSKLLDFIERGGGAASANCVTKGTQNLVLFVGGGGAHGYISLLFPHPDMFAGRDSEILASHFMQNATRGGNGVLPGLANGINYTLAPAENHPMRGQWASNERYKRVYGVDNQAFRGFKSMNATSRNIDTTFWGNEDVPSNLSAGAKAKNFLTVNRETPWIHKYGLKKGITAVDGGGINDFHVTGAHNHYIDFDKKWSVMAAAATIQLTRPSIVPAILVADMNPQIGGGSATFYGRPGVNLVPGAPTPALVANATGMVDLFNSNAARAGGALSNPANAVLYEAYVKGMIGSSKTAGLPTFNRGYRTSKLGANLVGLNLSEKLLPTQDDRDRYGYTGNVAKIAEMRDNMIVAAKALKLGLTSQIVMRYFNDDPHSSFTANGEGGTTAAAVAIAISNFMNAFMEDLMSVDDPLCPGIKLGDNTVIGFIGDVPRTNLSRNEWNDPTYGGQNRAWIMSNGLLRTGFFGGDRPLFPGDGNVTSNNHLARGPGEGGLFNPETGDLIQFDPAGATGMIGGRDLRREYGEIAMASILYAVTRGDTRRVNDFYPGVPFPAIQVPVLL